MDKGDKLHQIEAMVARVLQTGVALSVCTLLVGWAISLTTHFESFSGDQYRSQFLDLEAEFPRTLQTLGQGLASGSGRAVMVLGLVVLMLTPLLRVFASLIVFVVQRDRIYFLLTALVLVLLGVSLVMGNTH